MPKKFRVEGSGENRQRAVATEFFKYTTRDVGKMLGMAASASERNLGMVGGLIAKIHLGAGHLPIAMSAGPALLMEVEVRSFAGIAMLPAPHLHAGARITSEKCDASLLALGSIGVVGVITRSG